MVDVFERLLRTVDEELLLEELVARAFAPEPAPGATVGPAASLTAFLLIASMASWALIFALVVVANGVVCSSTSIFSGPIFSGRGSCCFAFNLPSMWFKL